VYVSATGTEEGDMNFKENYVDSNMIILRKNFSAET